MDGWARTVLEMLNYGIIKASPHTGWGVLKRNTCFLFFLIITSSRKAPRCI